MSQQGYTGEEKARIRAGFQCPECFGSQVETISTGTFEPLRFQCTECGSQWSASAPQFQGGGNLPLNSRSI
jgi:ribosomal protein L37AE/L43A